MHSFYYFKNMIVDKCIWHILLSFNRIIPASLVNYMTYDP